jgi:hypothetical protein
MHSIEYGYAPTSFSAVWPKHKARNLVYELRSQEHYVMPNPYIEMFNNSLQYVWRWILQVLVISSITTTKNRNLRKQKLIEETWAFWILRDFQLNYLPNWFGLVLWCQTGDYNNTWGGMVAQWQRAWLLSCSPGFKSGVSPAHSRLPIFWWVATWDGTWLRADLCEGRQRRKLWEMDRGTPKT